MVGCGGVGVGEGSGGGCDLFVMVFLSLCFWLWCFCGVALCSCFRLFLVAPGEKTILDCHKFVRVTSAVFADNVM